MATDHNFKVKNGLDVEGANIKIVDGSSGNALLDASGDIILDAGGANINFNDDGTAVGHIEMAGQNLEIKSKVADKDIFLKGNDGGTAITALHLDMSQSGQATFNSNVAATSFFGQNLYITSSGFSAVNRIDNDGSALYLTYGGTSNRALEVNNSTGAVTLKHGTNTKLVTTSTGVQITGTLDVDVISNASGSVHLNDTLYFQDNSKAVFGDSSDLQIYHNGTDSAIDNLTGDLYITNTANDKDILFRSDNGSGGFETYFLLDGSNAKTQFNRHLKIIDNMEIQIGTNPDMLLYHDGSNSHIKDTGTGELKIASNTLRITNAAGNETSAKFVEDGFVELFHNNVSKFKTETTGIRVEATGAHSGIRGYGTSPGVYLHDTDSTTGWHMSSNGALYFLHDTDGDGVYNSIAGYFDSGRNWVIYTGALKMGTSALTVIDSNRNLTNIGTISSGNITSSGSITSGTNLKTSNGIITLTHSGNTHDYNIYGRDNTFRILWGGGTKIYAKSGHSLHFGNYNGDQGGTDADHQDPRIIATGATTIDSLAVKGLHFATNDTNRFTIAADGKASFREHVTLDDNKQLRIGTGEDLRIYHDGSSSILDNAVGHLDIKNSADDADIRFYGDDGSGGLAQYLRIDGSDTLTRSYKTILFQDNVKASFGNSEDMRIKHDGTNGSIDNYTGDLLIRNNADDKDVVLQSDNGSGGLADYVRLDGSTGLTQFDKDTKHSDNIKATFGAGSDLQIHHDGTNNLIQGSAGVVLYIQAKAGENSILAIPDGSVQLYHDNSKKFETKSDGVDITGELQSDSLDVDGNADISGNLVLGGNLTVSGTTTTVSSTNTTITDALIELNSGLTGANTNDIGFIFERGSTGSNMGIIFDESADAFSFINTATSTGATTGNVVIDGYQKITAGHGSRITGDLQVGDTVNQNAYGILQVNQTSNVDEEGIGILSASHARSMRLWVDESVSYVSSGNGGVGILSLNHGGGNVGIGTTSPARPLTVDSGTTNHAYSPTSFNSNSQIKIDVASTQNNYAGIQFTHSGNTEGFIGLVRTSTNISDADFVIQSYSHSTSSYSEKMRITDEGNVGIGTTSPTHALTVNGDVQIEGNGSGNSSHILYFKNSAAAIQRNNNDLKLHAYNAMIFGVSNTAYPTSTERMRIDSSGNVGIGTSSPNQWASYTDSGATVFQVKDTSDRARIVINGGNGAHLDLVDYAGSANDKHMNIAVDAGILKFGSLNDAGSAFVQDNIMAMDLGTGSVGIGTSTPSGGLHVVDFIRVDSSEGIATRKVRSGYFSTGQNLTLETNNAANIVMSTGGVGISTSSVLSGVKLDVRGGNIHVGGYGSTGNNYGVRYSSDDGSSHWYTYSDTGGELVFGRSGTIGDQEKVRFDASGNVGIGTNNPLSRLHLASSTDYEVYFDHTGSGAETFRLSHGTSGLYMRGPDTTNIMFGWTQDHDVKFYNTSAQQYLIGDGSNGSIGIGPGPSGSGITPEALVEIYSNVNGDATNLLVMNQKSYGSGTGTNERATIALGIAEASQSSLSRLFGTIHVRTANESDSSNGIFSFGVRGGGAIRDDVLVIRALSSTDQRVGIGTNNPAEKLQVKGALGLEPTNSTNRWSVYTWTDNSFRLNYNGAGADELILDSSGRMMIGTTSANGVNGVTINNGGYVYANRSGGISGYFDRASSDGNVVAFRKDGTDVGYIGIDNSDNLVIEGKSDHSGLQFGTGTIIPHKAGAAIDNNINLGNSTYRFANITAVSFTGDGSNLTGVTVSNADTVDSLHASQFIRSDTADTVTGVITFAATPTLGGTAANEGGEINFGAPTGGGSSFALDNYQGHFRVHTLASGKEFRIHSASSGLTTIGSNIGTVWASGNDGSGSGLDADTVDGVEATNLTKTTAQTTQNMANHAITAVNNLEFNDPGVNEGIKWNQGNLWQIYESPNAQTNAAGNLQFTSGSGNGTIRMTLDTSGGLNVTGTLTATAKSFDIEHPTKEGMRLHHGVLEGPEHAVYIRGKSNSYIIELPDYWEGLVHEDTITVQLTPIGGQNNMWVENIEDNKVYIECEREMKQYFYFIQAERKDVERFEVEYDDSIQ